MIANSNILGLHSVYTDDGLCYIGAIAWITAMCNPLNEKIMEITGAAGNAA